MNLISISLQIFCSLRLERLIFKACRSIARAPSVNRAPSKEFGADLVVDPGKADWSEEVLKATAGKGAEAIIDMVSRPVLNGKGRRDAGAYRLTFAFRLKSSQIAVVEIGA